MKITMNEAFGTGVKANLKEAYKQVNDAYINLKRINSNLDILDDAYKPTQEEMNEFRKAYIYIEKANKILEDWVGFKDDREELKRNSYKNNKK